ncbi:MAG: peptide deformylase [Oscillospiraceae bacterium]
MIKEIVHDTFFLQMKSTPACEEDLQTAADLLETLKAHTADCVGMAANMIGVSKRIIAVNDNGQFFVMLNPEIIKCSGAFEAEEGCLSLSGTRKTKRYKNIKVKFQNTLFQERIKTFSGWTAQIIQHEIDHCNGILI